ncbi:MAG TPA: hypothetical protein VGP66_03710 [Candidatus Acidoferrum sp.]|jgi:hypothetical protein|nr:hypothetical protein [Candidatus Acidoferrum sp.]
MILSAEAKLPLLPGYPEQPIPLKVKSQPGIIDNRYATKKVAEIMLDFPFKTLGRTYLTCALCLPSVLFAQTNISSVTQQKTELRVPFVGCKSDGQVGPREEPTGESKLVAIPASETKRLAYYASEGGWGVLGPSGWYCFGTYGSSGATLYVSPQPIVVSELFSKTWGGFPGPVIEIAHEYGDTSGRFAVAKVIARVFPKRRAFVNKVIKEEIESASSFPFGPYPKDKLVYKAEDIVEYETPANTEGLGTYSRLKANAYPIKGVAMLLGNTPDLTHLAVRLSPGTADLAPSIMQQAEKDAGNYAP